MAKSGHVFVSHHHVDAAPVGALADALTERGVRVRLGQQDIADASDITRGISQEIAGAKALVAYYSTSYATRRACQWELTAALVAGGHHGNLSQRVLVVNPEPRLSHIYPLELRNAVYRVPSTTGDQDGLAHLADRIAQQVAELSTPLGTMGPLAAPRWLPGPRIGPARFVGRLPELWQIHAWLREGADSMAAGPRPPVQVWGFAGVGKSLLVEEYALRFGGAYPGGVVWLDAHGHDRLMASGARLLTGQLDGELRAATWQTAVEAELRAIAAALGLPLKDLDPDQLRAELAAAIQASGKPWLWIVDDVPDGLEEEQLKGLLGPHPLAVTLLTTRGEDTNTLVRALNLGMLPMTDGYTLLTSRRSPRGLADRQVARELVAEHGGHPLTLDVAAAALAQADEQATAAEFRRRGGHLSRGLARELDQLLPRSHSAAIARTLAASIGRLSEDGADLLRLAAELAATPISIRMLTEVFATVDQLEEPLAARRAAGAVYQALLASLARPADERADWFEVHPLVAHMARSTDPDPVRRAAVRSAAAAVLVRAIEAADPLDRRVQPALAAASTHARALLSHPGSAVSQAELYLLGAVARSEYASGHHLTAASLFQQQWDACRRVLGEEHPVTLAAMDNLMGALDATGGQIAGRELYEQVLAIRRRTLGEEHPATLAATISLAESYQALGELVAARQLHEQALAAFRRKLGKDHQVTLELMRKVAMLQQATGELGEARELHEQLLAARRRTGGWEHPATLDALHSLAGILFMLGELDEARELYLQALFARDRTLGKEHPDTLAEMSSLGLVFQATGELAQARGLHEQVATLSRRVFGEEHPATLAAMNNLAGVLYELGELTEARELHERAVAACRRVLGEDHPDTLTAMANLGLALHDLGELEQACRLHEQVLVRRRRILGEDHPDTLDATSHLAATLHDLGELDAARRLHEQALAACQRVFGEDHLETLSARSSLGRTLHDLGQLADARKVQEQVLASCRRVLGPEHPVTLDSMADLATTLDAEGHHRKANNLRTLVEQRAGRIRSSMQS